MGHLAIKMDDVAKLYRLGEYHTGGSMREAVSSWAGRVARGRRRDITEIWSLKNIDLEIEAGSSLGVVGHNGAGKTTMLKILSRITEPTRGISKTRGRVASLLEVGTGFHQELTGRENVYLNGAILGMTRREIDARFDEIVEFSGVARFLDTPVKRYSSGMHLRLAFSVAAHLQSDILLVDEILAVGDVEFQQKCIGRMRDVEKEGRTVVFVSHDLEAVAGLCNEGIWLHQGEVRGRGPARTVIRDYLASAVETHGAALHADERSPAKLTSLAIFDEFGAPAQVLLRDRPFTIEMELQLTEHLAGFDAAIYVLNQWGARVIDEAWSDTAQRRAERPGRYRVRIEMPPILNVGEYRLGVWLGNAEQTFLDDPARLRFRLEGSVKGRPQRAVELLLPWVLEHAEESSDRGEGGG